MRKERYTDNRVRALPFKADETLFEKIEHIFKTYKDNLHENS